MRNDGFNAYAQPEQLGVLYIIRLISTYQVSSARLEK